MTWRVANSLITLIGQINAAYPNRNKASDGTIGDPNHQAEGSGSDHNPSKHGVVCALDITHDPAHGVDIDKLSDALAASRDPRIKYLIANSQILVPADYGWTWQPYYGSNPHTSHLHVSVYGDYDNTAAWNMGNKEEDMTTKEAHDIGVAVYRSVYGREPENSTVAKNMGRSLADKSGNLTPSSVIRGLQAQTKTTEWKHRAERAKSSDALNRTNVMDYLSSNLK